MYQSYVARTEGANGAEFMTAASRASLAAAALIAAYGLSAGHIAVAAFAVGAILAFQVRAEGCDVRENRAARAGVTTSSSGLSIPVRNKPMVMDGGSLEHRRTALGRC